MTKDRTKIEEAFTHEAECVQQYVAATRMALAMRHTLMQGKHDWYGDAAIEIRDRMFTNATKEAMTALYWAQYHNARRDLYCEQGCVVEVVMVRVTSEWVAACQRELAHTLFEEPWTPEDTLPGCV
jgi:hypothetical protein